MSFLGVIVKFFSNLVRRPNNTIKNSGRDVNVNNTVINDPAIVKWVISAFVVVIIALMVFVIVFIICFSTHQVDKQVPVKNNILTNSIEKVSVHKIDKIIEKAHIDLSRVPDGYFIALQRIGPVIDTVVDNGLGVVPWIRVDVSVGNSFDAYMKKKDPDTYTKRLDCTYLYDEEQTKRIPIKCYPMEWADEFDSFLVNEYMTKKQWRYIDN